jgi:hypothetical protein
LLLLLCCLQCGIPGGNAVINLNLQDVVFGQKIMAGVFVLGYLLLRKSALTGMLLGNVGVLVVYTKAGFKLLSSAQTQCTCCCPACRC